MKLSEIYAKSKAWMFEKKSSTIYNDYIVEITNKIIAELYEENKTTVRADYTEFQTAVYTAQDAE